MESLLTKRETVVSFLWDFQRKNQKSWIAAITLPTTVKSNRDPKALAWALEIMFRTREERADAEVTLTRYATVFQYLTQVLGLNHDTLEAFDVNMGRVEDFIRTRRYVRKLPAAGGLGAATYTLTFKNVRFERVETTPYRCQFLTRETYDTELKAQPYIELNYEDGGSKVFEPKDSDTISFGRFPVLVGSRKYCAVDWKDPVPQGEDRHETGYFVFDGTPRQFVQREILRFNKVINYIGKSGRFISTITSEGKWGNTAIFAITVDQAGVARLLMLRGYTKKDVKDLNVFQLIELLLGLPESLDLEGLIEEILSNVDPVHHDRLRIALAPSIDDYKTSDIVHDILSVKGHDTSIPDYLTTFGKSFMRGKYVSDLNAQIFPHIPEPRDDDPDLAANQARAVSQRRTMICLMIARLLECELKIREAINLNSYSNKRFKRYPESMLHLWGIYWKQRIDELFWKLDPRVSTQNHLHIVISTFAEKNMTNHFSYSNKTKWGLEGERSIKETRFFEDFKNDYYLSAHHHRHKIVRDRNPRSRTIAVRLVMFTQLGRVDPAETPETQRLGLNGTRSAGCYSSIYRDPSILEERLRQSDLFSLGLTRTVDFPDLVLLNAAPYGTCLGKDLEDYLRDLRRRGALDRDILVLYLPKDRVLYLNTDSSRPCRPLLTINKETGRLVLDEILEQDPKLLKTLMAPKKAKGSYHTSLLDELTSRGALDYLDIMEEEYRIICPSPETYKAKQEEFRAALEEYEKVRALEVTITTIPYFRSIKVPSLILTEAEHLSEYQELLGPREEQLRAIEREEVSLTEELSSLIDHPESDDFVEKFEMLRGRADHLKTQKKQLGLEDLQLKFEGAALSGPDYQRILREWDEEIRELEKGLAYDYCDIDPNSMWGITSLMMPYPNHDPGPRVTFAAKMVKQSIGHHHDAERWRFDKTKTLLYGARPITETPSVNLIDMPSHTSGFNAMVAVITHQQFSVEDATVINRASVERGMGISVDKQVLTEQWDYQAMGGIQDDARISLILAGDEDMPKEIKESKNRRHRGGKNIYRHLGKDGIVKVGSRVEIGDCVLGRYQRIERLDGGPLEYIDFSIYAKKSKSGTVNKVLFHTKNTIARLMVEVVRFNIPELADKFATRHAQKGVCGLIEDHINIPYSAETGMTPDILFDPHGYPSRMTSGQNIESLEAKAAACEGVRRDVAGFRDRDIEWARQTLVKHGFNSSGTEIFINPRTGEPFEVEIFFGVLYYQKLVHEATDKIQSRATGIYKTTTRQPITGKDNGGAMKYGEQERATIIYHGMSEVMKEVFLDASDNFYETVCECKTSTRALPGDYAAHWCRKCDRPVTKAYRVQQPYTLKMLDNYNAGYGVRTLTSYREKERVW